MLIGFARVSLELGAAAVVTFRIHADRTSYTTTDLTRIVEPGEIELLVGTSSQDLPCRSMVELAGPVRTVGHDRVLTTPVEIVSVGQESDRTIVQ